MIHLKRNMPASITDTPSAKKVRFSSNTIAPSNMPTKSISEQCEEVFSFGLSTLHNCIQLNSTVSELKPKFVSNLIKISEKSKALKRLEAEDFVPHSIRFKTILKTDKATANRGDFKELSQKFEDLRLDSQNKYKAIMIKARIVELDQRKREIMEMTSTFIREIAEDLIVINGHAESPEDIDTHGLNLIHNAVISHETVSPVLFGLDAKLLPTEPIEIESDSESDDSTTMSEDYNTDTGEQQRKRRRNNNSPDQNTGLSQTCVIFQRSKYDTIEEDVRDAVANTLISTIEKYTKLQKEAEIREKLKKKELKKKADERSQATADETEKFLEELDNGKTLKELIDEQLKSREKNNLSKGKRGVTKPKKNASLKNKKDSHGKQKGERKNSGGGNNNASKGNKKNSNNPKQSNKGKKRKEKKKKDSTTSKPPSSSK